LKRTPLLRLDWALAVHNCLPYPGLDKKPVPYGIVSPYAPSGADVPHARDNLESSAGWLRAQVMAEHQSDTTTGSDEERYTGQPHGVGSGKQFLFLMPGRRERRVVYVGAL